jgi:L-alanine-DL-glutamate epimerase-like enolase superfamily enzyme
MALLRLRCLPRKRGANFISRISPKETTPLAALFRTAQNPPRDELLTDKFVLDHGSLLVPQSPGLGVKVDDNVLAKYGAPR